MLTQSIRIIGIDPGLRRTGWGIVESDGVRLAYVASGLVTSDGGGELAYRLREIYEGLCGVIARYGPQEAAVEETFVNKDARATLKLGQARGMALLAPASSGLKVAEYPPNVIKKTVTGTGHGEKRQVAAMVGFLLPRARFGGADEADALAIAICHANHRSVGWVKRSADPTQADPTAPTGRASALKALGLRYRSTQPTRGRRGT
jgi:crossover junction endodeoxyribonuclease RuvC